MLQIAQSQRSALARHTLKQILNIEQDTAAQSCNTQSSTAERVEG
jgi:hypothetical protein